MNRKWIHRLLSVLLVALLAAVLSGCERPNPGQQTEDGFRDEKTGVDYVLCHPLAVKPLALDTEKVYCAAGGVNYYSIPFQEPTDFLADFDKQSSSSFVYRSAEQPEITIQSFDAIAAFLYLDGKTPVRIGQLYADDEFLPDDLKGQSPSQDTAKVRKVVEALTTGEERTVLDADVKADSLLYLRLLSAKYPGLYYNVCFFEDRYGKFYVEDFATRRIADAPEEIVTWIIG